MADLDALLRSIAPKCESFKVKIFGHEFLGIGTKEDFAITTEEHYGGYPGSFDPFPVSLAHFKNGIILRFGFQIGTAKDIEFLE